MSGSRRGAVHLAGASAAEPGQRRNQANTGRLALFVHGDPLRCPGRHMVEREFPTVDFERYADDAVVHCATERRAREVLAALEARIEVG